MNKICIKCNEEKSILDFNKRKQSKDGYSNTCKSCTNSYMKDYKKNNKDKISILNKRYRDNNKEKLKEINRNYISNKYKNNLEFKLISNLRSRVFKSLNRKTETTLELLGASIEEVIVYLNDNEYGFVYGDVGLDVDHIIPLSTGKTEREIKKLCNYKNMQLLPFYYNRYIKQDKEFNKKHFNNWLENELAV